MGDSSTTNAYGPATDRYTDMYVALELLQTVLTRQGPGATKALILTLIMVSDNMLHETEGISQALAVHVCNSEMKLAPTMVMNAPEYSYARTTGLKGAKDGLFHTRRV